MLVIQINSQLLVRISTQKKTSGYHNTNANKLAHKLKQELETMHQF